MLSKDFIIFSDEFICIKEFLNIHARFEFCAICAVICCQRKKRDSMIVDNSELLKMACYTKEQRVFTVVQYFKNIEDFSTNDF